jgi:TRAP-type transport system small permease protein
VSSAVDSVRPPAAWRWYLATLRAVLAALLTAVIVITFANVARRYFGYGTFPWADETARRLLVWMTLLGAALAVAHASHLRIDTLVDNATGRRGTVLRAVVNLFSIAFFLLLIWGGGRFTLASADRVTPSMEISAAWTTSAVPIGGVLMLISFLARLRFGPAEPPPPEGSLLDLDPAAGAH